MFKLILYIVILFIYISLFYLGNYNLRLTLTVLEIIISISIFLYYLIISFKHSKLKEYFWTNLNVENKKFMNYAGHCSTHAIDGANIHPFSFYWKKEVTFQKKRNIIILMYNKKKGEALISTEKILCDVEIILFFLIIVAIFSFNNLT